MKAEDVPFRVKRFFFHTDTRVACFLLGLVGIEILLNMCLYRVRTIRGKQTTPTGFVAPAQLVDPLDCAC